MNTTTAEQWIKNTLSPEGVCRRSDLLNISNKDRLLKKLLTENVLKKVQNGLYFFPKKTVFGQSLPDTKKLLKKFLNDDHFVVYNLSQFNSLGLGTTQLYDTQIVFNRKRSGKIKLAGCTYIFYRWREAPKSLSKEFLLVELFNKANYLSEDFEKILKNLEQKLIEFNKKKLLKFLDHFGTKSTQNKLYPLLSKV